MENKKNRNHWGFAVYRDEDGIKSDFEIPLFKQNRAFIDKYLII